MLQHQGRNFRVPSTYVIDDDTGVDEYHGR
jgi:hypothetical protein